MFDGCSLGLNALLLVKIKELIKAEIGRHLGGVGEQIKNEQRSTKGHDLDEDDRL